MMDAFASADRVRRRTGAWLDAAGLGPRETPARLVHAGHGFDLLAYDELLEYDPPAAGGPVVLLLPAPIKRAYIWDLAPRVSVVRRCLERGLRVHLLRWTDPAASADGELGLADYVTRLLPDAMRAIEAETGERHPVLAGHSLGGTLAALLAAACPERVGGLVLLEAPIRFGPGGAGAFAPALAAGPSPGSLRGQTVPGSWLGLAATMAAPEVFVWERWVDRMASLRDPERLLLHYRVERWMLDELPWSRQLWDDVVRLYREDAFMQGTLTLGGRDLRPALVTAPVLAVVNPASRIVPYESVQPFLAAAGTRDTSLLDYRGDRGVSLQHVGVLVGHRAHRELWPRILDWIACHR